MRARRGDKIRLATFALAASLSSGMAWADGLQSYRLPSAQSSEHDPDALNRALQSLPEQELPSPAPPTATDVGLAKSRESTQTSVGSVILTQSLQLAHAEPSSASAGGRLPTASGSSRTAQTTSWFGKTRSIPEPASICLLLAGLIGIAARRWLQRTNALPGSSQKGTGRELGR